MNISKLRGIMAERGMTMREAAQACGISYITFYRRLQSGGEDFTIGEFVSLASILSITQDELTDIFALPADEGMTPPKLRHDLTQYKWRRFIRIGDDNTMNRFLTLCEKKKLSRDDLALILRSIKPDPDIFQQLYGGADSMIQPKKEGS